jgi:hypothetical protein
MALLSPSSRLASQISVDPRSLNHEQFFPTSIPELNHLSNEFARVVDHRYLTSALSEPQRAAVNIAKGVLKNYPGLVNELPLAIQCEQSRSGLPKSVHFFGSNDEFILRCGLMALYSWSFSIADSRVEEAVAAAHVSGKKIGKEEILQTAFTSKVTDIPIMQCKTSRSISVGEILESVIPSLEGTFGFEGSPQRKQQLGTVIQSQLHGLDLVKNFARNGVPYSIEEATSYLNGTVVDYGRLLASLLFSDENKRKQFTKMIAVYNLRDDREDFLADLFSQPNVYLAVAFQKTGLQAFVQKWKELNAQVMPHSGMKHDSEVSQKIVKRFGKLFVAAHPGLNRAFNEITRDVLIAVAE